MNAKNTKKVDFNNLVTPWVFGQIGLWRDENSKGKSKATAIFESLCSSANRDQYTVSHLLFDFVGILSDWIPYPLPPFHRTN